MLDAVSGALDGDGDQKDKGGAKGGKTAGKAAAGEDGADTDGDEGGDDGSDGGDAGDDGAGAGDDAGDEGAAGEDDDAAAGGEEAAAGTGAGEGDEAGEEEEGEDEFTPPKGLKERSAKRWDGLVARTKTAETAANNFRQVLNDTGASRDDISRTLYLLRLVNRGGREGLQEALKRIDGERNRIAKMLGVEVPGVDLLADFPDLTQEVEDMKTTRERALEIAAARRERERQDTQGRQQREDGERQAQVKQAQTQAFADLDALGEELGKTDVDYDAKFKLLKENGEIEDIIKTFHPSQWKSQFQRRYNLLGKAGGGQRRQGAPTNKQRPLRTTGQGGGGSAAPKSLSEAINLAVAGSSDE